MSEPDERPMTRTEDLPAHGTTAEGFDGAETAPARGAALRLSWWDWLWIEASFGFDLLILLIAPLLAFTLRYTVPSVGIPVSWVVTVLLLLFATGRFLGIGGCR